LSAVLILPREARDKLKREAEKLGISLEEYILEYIMEYKDNKERARDYIQLSTELLKRAKEELDRGYVRYAAGRLWSAASLAIRAHAYLRDGKRLLGLREIWSYMGALAKTYGDWVREAWGQACAMQICFYDEPCTAEDVEYAYRSIERLVSDLNSQHM